MVCWSSTQPHRENKASLDYVGKESHFVTTIQNEVKQWFNSIFNIFWKNKNIMCRLFITTFQPLELAFFNSINKLLTIFEFWIILYFFLLTIFFLCCTIPNDLKILKHVADLPWIRNQKGNRHFRHSFILMWLSEVQLPGFSQGLKKDFCHFKCSIYMVKNSEKFSASLKSNILQDPTVTLEKISGQ